MKTFSIAIFFAAFVAANAIFPYFIVAGLLGAGIKTVEQIVSLESDEVYVRVVNTMGKGVEVTADCASGDDTIETQILKDGDSFAWKFSPNFFGNTLFYCNVKTNDGKSKGWDVYKGKEDSKNWYLRGDGIYTGKEDGSNLEKKEDW
uniref:S-protein homolog n=1 Tax=Panagrolaimus sp. PS1159 TaxID=55785 RepID=A0AC35F7M3_9BILA